MMSRLFQLFILYLQKQHHGTEPAIGYQSVTTPHPGMALNSQYLDSEQTPAHLPLRI